MKNLTISFILSFALICGKLVDCQYYDSRDVWGIAVEAIYDTAKLQASIAAKKQELIRGDKFCTTLIKSDTNEFQ